MASCTKAPVQEMLGQVGMITSLSSLGSTWRGSRHVTSRHVTSRHGTSRHVTSRHHYLHVVLLLGHIYVAVLDARELLAEDELDHLLPEDGAGQAGQPVVDAVLEDLEHPLGHTLHQERLALGQGNVRHHLVFQVPESPKT